MLYATTRLIAWLVPFVKLPMSRGDAYKSSPALSSHSFFITLHFFSVREYHTTGLWNLSAPLCNLLKMATNSQMSFLVFSAAKNQILAVIGT
jgi:hypothetical protein